MRKIVYTILAFLVVSTVAYCAPQGQPKHITYAGLNTKGGPLSLTDGESPNALNVHSDIFGTLLKRHGYTKLNTVGTHSHISTSPGVCNGLFDYAVDSSTRKLMGYFDDGLYKMDDLDGTFDQVTVATAMTDDIIDFENFDGTLIMTTWSRDTPQSWAGTGATANITDMPTGKHVIKAYNRLFVSDVTVSTVNYPLRFYFSNSGSYTTWTTGTDYETLDAGEGDRAMGWGLLKGRLIGFSKYSVNIVSDVGGTYPIEVKKRIDGTGCGAPRSIKTINSPKYGECVIWLTNDKRLVLWDGSRVVDVGEKVFTGNDTCPFSLQSIDSSVLEYSHAEVDESNNWYVLYIPIGSAIDYCIKYDYKSDNVWADSNQNFYSSTLVETTTGNFIYVGEKDGKVHKWNNGTSDNGSTINAYWTSRKWDFGFAPFLKKMGETQIVTKTIGNYPLYYQSRYNWDTSWSSQEEMTMVTGGDWLLGDALPAILGGHLAQVHRLTIPYAYNLYQIKLTDNSSNPQWQVYSLDIVTSISGSVND